MSQDKEDVSAKRGPSALEEVERLAANFKEMHGEFLLWGLAMSVVLEYLDQEGWSAYRAPSVEKLWGFLGDSWKPLGDLYDENMKARRALEAESPRHGEALAEPSPTSPLPSPSLELREALRLEWESYLDPAFVRDFILTGFDKVAQGSEAPAPGAEIYDPTHDCEEYCAMCLGLKKRREEGPSHG